MAKSTNKFMSSGELASVTTYQAGVMQAASHRVLQRHCDEILKDYGITKMQWLIIGTVLDAGDDGMRITDLAEKLGTNLSYLTNTINLLENKQILTRKNHATDSRAKLVCVEHNFTKQCQEIEDTLRNGLRDSIYSQVSPEEFHVYMKVMNQLAEIGLQPRD